MVDLVAGFRMAEIIAGTPDPLGTVKDGKLLYAEFQTMKASKTPFSLSTFIEAPSTPALVSALANISTLANTLLKDPTDGPIVKEFIASLG